MECMVSLSDTAAAGDRLATLRATRQRLAEAIDIAVMDRAVGIIPQTASVLAKVLAEIEELEGRKPVASVTDSLRDELKAQREARKQNPDAPSHARRRR